MDLIKVHASVEIMNLMILLYNGVWVIVVTLNVNTVLHNYTMAV